MEQENLKNVEIKLYVTVAPNHKVSRFNPIPAMSTTFLSIDKFQINLNRLENGCFLDDLEKILTFKMTLLYRVFVSFEFLSRSQNEVKWSASSLLGIYLNPYSSLKCD